VLGAVAQTARYCASRNISSSNDVLYDAQQESITLSGILIDTIINAADTMPRQAWHVGMAGLKQTMSSELA
jgi:hypothetical protein